MYDLDRIREEFLQFAPSYVKGPAIKAIANLIDLSRKKIIPDGLYYIVLTDLVGSTQFAVEKGNDALDSRIKSFVSNSVLALNSFEPKSKSLFIKEIGDAVLLLFQHFPDIINWNYNFKQYLDLISKNEFPIKTRTIIHQGEVSLKGVNPIGLSVSQTFKLEKDVPDNQIGLSEAAFFSAYPTISRAYYGFSKLKKVQMPGYNEEIWLYKLNISDNLEIRNVIEEDHEYS